MPDDSEGRARKPDDLFEDLDKFFAPIRDVDWPEEGEEAQEGQEGRTAEGDDATSSDRPQDVTVPAETVQAETVQRESVQRETVQPALDESAPPAADPSQYLGQPTQEMSGEDWEDLRTRFGPDRPLDVEPGPQGEGEAEPYSFLDQFLPREGEEARPEGPAAVAPRPEPPAPEPPAPEPPAPEESLAPELAAPDDAGPEAGHGTGQPPITIDDLRKAPDQYRDLPPPLGEDEESAEEPAGVAAGPMGEEEPPPGGVEAAAEHFAESIRQSGELPVIEPEHFEPAVPGPGEDDLLGDLDQEPRQPRTIRVGVSDTVGPSWQEPTSEEVLGEGEAETARGGRNIPLAFLSGVVLAVIGVGSIAISKAAFAVVATIVVLLAQLELYTALRRRHFQPAVPLGLVFGALTMAAAYLKGPEAMLAMAALAVMFTFLWFMAVPTSQRKNVLANVGLTLFPYFYVAVLAGYVVIILALSKALVLSVLALAVGYDVAAFAIGSLWGSRPLAPSISPRKSWEGAIGATLVLLLVSVAVLASIDPISTVGRAVGLAIVASIFAPIGDLAESLLKRDLGVKDIGTIMPGHGGALDRIDSILFVAPAAFYFIRIFF
ncbi:MAG: phosphatidate cytidylyltransferase [Actinomycetota bacterium]|nr:phosphatidate cytidylyltransferase [Actinomycetota bacterium]